MGQGHEGPLFLRVCLKRKVSCNGILRFRATAFLVLPMSHVPGLQALFLTTLFRTCVMRKREGYRTTVRPTEAASVLQSRRRRSYSSWRRRAVGYSTSVPARVYVPAVLAQRSAFSFPPVLYRLPSGSGSRGHLQEENTTGKGYASRCFRKLHAIFTPQSPFTFRTLHHHHGAQQ